MSLILSMDLSLNSTGAVIMDMDSGYPSHYEAITSDLSGIERLTYNYNRYMNLLETNKDIEYIVFEAQNPGMRRAYTAANILDLAENVGVWKLAVCQSIPKLTKPPIVLSIIADDIKEFATGNRRADKDEMIAAVNGHHIKSIRSSVPEHSVNDVADAYHLAKLTRDLILNDKDISKYILKDYRIIVKETN